jgi:hypothetical protein
MFLLPLAAAPHPRLYLNPDRVSELRVSIGTTHAEIWAAVKKQADSIATSHPPVFERVKDNSADAQLWQREVGNKLPYLAITYVLTGRVSYLDSAREWSLASCHYPHWGLGRKDGTDLAAGHQLFGLALVYDWLYNDLDPATRETIRRTLIDRGAVMFTADSRRTSYLQNHLWVDTCGLAAAGYALLDDPEAGTQASGWIAMALDKFRRTESVLGPDGASHEGVGYWSYGVEYLLKFWGLREEDPQSTWWSKTALYRLYLSLPRNSWTRFNTVIDVADCPRNDWYGPDYLLHRLAALNRDSRAEWLARELSRAGVCGTHATWLGLVWLDPKISPAPPGGLPTLRHFSDMDLVSARTDWSGDESLMVFKCGPAIGHKATAQFDFDPGSGHAHPDANHFVLFGNGEWLIRDDGYRWKMTDQHNTLLIDGKGQLGEDAMYFRGLDQLKIKAQPRVLAAVSTPTVDSIIGDATEAYPKHSGLLRFERRIVFLKPDALIVADEVVLNRPHSLELRFHPEYPAVKDESGAYICRGKMAKLRLEPLTVADVEITAGDFPARDGEGGKSSLNTIRLATSKAFWRNAVVLSWSPVRQEPVRVSLEGHGDEWRFKVGSRAFTIRWDDHRAPQP